MAQHHQMSIANDAFSVHALHKQGPSGPHPHCSCGSLGSGCRWGEPRVPGSGCNSSPSRQSHVVTFCPFSSVLLSFLLSLCFAVPRAVYCKCRYQIRGSDQLQVLNGRLEITVCSFCYYYYCCHCSHYYLMLLFASGSISSQFPHPVLPPRQSICFAHPC